MKLTLKEIALFLGGTIIGDDTVIIENIRPMDEAGERDITFLANNKYAKQLKTTGASAIIAAPGTEAAGKNLVIVPDPYAAFGRLLVLFYPQEHGQCGISPDAYIEKDAAVSPDACVFPRAFISRGAKIAKGAVIYPGVFIGRNVTIGENSILYANVTVYAGSQIGKRVILHSGVVIGGDGFGFAAPGKDNYKIPQVGFVQIDDDVEIGANSTVDRGTLGKTWIGRNVKIDNLVQIAHNVVIGENSVITAQVGISGSAKLGKNVIIGGQTGIVGHITIGDNVMIAAGSGIHKEIESGQIVAGRPQLPYRQWLKVEASRVKLPEIKAALEELKRKVEKLQEHRNEG
ncbi:MAG: UDP-3-O-acylglucosamine N-acyltransferase [Smithella sp. PtaU1.Bin162]|nr:MAG: UDP-3-O-acylglucosamine N-acyltransferase [Smithella sp. PtaU1.Bin162]